MSSSALKIEHVSIQRLFCSPKNPRINDPAVPHVAASIRRFGWRQPIVAKPSGEVIAGNTRLKAAVMIGMKTVPVVWFEGSDLEATAFAIADNRTHEFSEWDDVALANLLQELRAEDSLEGVGYSDEEINDLIEENRVDIPTEVDDPGPELPPKNPVTRRGDLWTLGDHRLLCGDSTKEKDLARLMNGEKASLFSSDPPYCVNYTGNDRPIHNGKSSGKDWSSLYREVEIKNYPGFLDAFLSATLPFTQSQIAVYLWHAHVQQPAIAQAFEKHGLLLHQIIVWVKPSATFGHSFYRWKHEPCVFGWRKGHQPRHGYGSLETVWSVDWEGKQRVIGNEHPTQKPVRLFEIPIEQHTKPGQIVLEPFCGSGSQLIAAEKLRRKCRALELEPAFVDVAIRRWEIATGKEAVLDGTKKSFAKIAKERGI